MLAQADRFFDDEQKTASLPSFQEDTALKLENWVVATAQSSGFGVAAQLLNEMPTENLKASTLYRIWYYSLIPYWIKHMPGKGFKKYRCLKKNDSFLHAEADLAGDRLWNDEDSLKLKSFLTRCKVM